MQALCQWDVQQDESSEVLREFVAARTTSEPVAQRAASLVEGYRERRQAVDDRIQAAAARWELPRISPVERNVMRVAVVELLNDEAPQKVILNEAIDIGRQYGGQDSSRFINGVLDVVLKRLQGRRTVQN
jgi:N utilization substance protein B